MNNGLSSIQNTGDVYSQFGAYDWKSDVEFQAGLKKILEQMPGSSNSSNTPSNQASDQAGNSKSNNGNSQSDEKVKALTLQAQAFYFKQKFGKTVDLNQYLEYQHNNKKNTSSEEHEQILKNGQQVQNDQSDQSSQNNQNEQNPPFSTNYAQIVELILAGKPIPGIREIPDTKLGLDSGSKPQAQRRLKPWETQVQSQPINQT